MTEGALRRFVGDIRPAGPLTLEASYVWTQDGQSQQATIKKLATPGLSLAAPQWLGADRPVLAIASGQGEVELSQGKATLRNLALVSNLVQLRGDGQTEIRALTSGDVEFSGVVNVAELCRQLPATLRLKPDTSVTSGQLQVALSSKPIQGSPRVAGRCGDSRI